MGRPAVAGTVAGLTVTAWQPMRALAGVLLAHGRLSPLAPVLPAAFASTTLR